MTPKTLYSGETMKLFYCLHYHVSHLVFFFFFTCFFLTCLRNRESYEIPPDLKIRGIQTSGKIYENFEKVSPAIEEVIQCFK